MELVTKEEYEKLSAAGQALAKVDDTLRYTDGLDEYVLTEVQDSISRLTEYYEGYQDGRSDDAEPDPSLFKYSTAYTEGYDAGYFHTDYYIPSDVEERHEERRQMGIDF